jgi:hypothetical protein
VTAGPAEERAARLLAMAAALEESILRFEESAPDETHDTLLRLRQLQDEILTAFLRCEGERLIPEG